MSQWSMVSDSRLEFSYRGDVFLVVDGVDDVSRTMQVLNLSGVCGECNIIQSDAEKAEEARRSEYEQLHCVECDRELGRKYYRIDHKHLCTRCYNKRDDAFMKQIKYKEV